MKTILLTGARAPVTLDLARALHRRGHRVIGAESMDYPLSKHSRAFSKFYRIAAPNESLDTFRSDLLSIIDREKVDALVPTCEEAFHVSRIRDAIPASIEVWVDDPRKLDSLHSKFQFNQLGIPLNFEAPKSYPVRSASEARDAVLALPGTHVVLKPDFSRFAAKTLILTKPEAEARLSSLDWSKTWVAQECLSGPEFCTYSVALRGKLVAHVTYDHEFTAGRGAGICFRAIEHPAIESWVRSFVQKNEFHGQIAFDFIEVSPGKVLPLECNPRATSGLHLIAQDREFLDLFSTSNAAPGSRPSRPKPGASGQLRLAMLVYGLPSLRPFSIEGLKRVGRWFAVFFGAREVVFSWKDPLPFFDQFVSFAKLILQAKRRNLSPLEVSTRDIEWNGKAESP